MRGALQLLATASLCLATEYQAIPQEVAARSELFAVSAAQSLDPSVRAGFAERVLDSAVGFNHTPGLFNRSATPEPGTQLDGLGALLPWPQILDKLSEPNAKLLLLLRHGQAYENLTPGGDNKL